MESGYTCRALIAVDTRLLVSHILHTQYVEAGKGRTHPNSKVNHPRLDEQQDDSLAECPSSCVRTITVPWVKAFDGFSELPVG